jgi:hypothetical protein
MTMYFSHLDPVLGFIPQHLLQQIFDELHLLLRQLYPPLLLRVLGSYLAVRLVK